MIFSNTFCEAESNQEQPSSNSNRFIGKDATIIAGNANLSLANSIASLLGSKVANAKIRKFADGETAIQIMEDVAGKHCYLIQSTSPPYTNDYLMELILLISACRRSGAASVTCIIPYYGYARQDRRGSAYAPISGADIAQILEFVGATRIISVDLHCIQTQGFVSPKVQFENIQAGFLGVPYFSKEIQDKKNIVIVSPDAGGMHRAKAFHDDLEKFTGLKDQLGMAMISKERKEANKIESMVLIGNVKGKTCIIIDDMIDTAGTLCEAGKLLKDEGATKVYAFATHGLFSGPAGDRIASSQLEKVVVTDTIQLTEDFQKKVGEKCEQISLDLLLAEIILRTHQKESLKEVYSMPSHQFLH